MFNGKLGNLANLMKNASKINEMMEKAKADMEKIEVTGDAGAGMVTITMTAKGSVKQLHIDDDVLKEEKSILIELIVSAINDAQNKIQHVTQNQMSAFSDLLGDKE